MNIQIPEERPLKFLKTSTTFILMNERLINFVIFRFHWIHLKLCNLYLKMSMLKHTLKPVFTTVKVCDQKLTGQFKKRLREFQVFQNHLQGRQAHASVDHMWGAPCLSQEMLRGLRLCPRLALEIAAALQGRRGEPT